MRSHWQLIAPRNTQTQNFTDTAEAESLMTTRKLEVLVVEMDSNWSGTPTNTLSTTTASLICPITASVQKLTDSLMILLYCFY